MAVDSLPKPHRVARRVAADVVVEVDPARAARIRPLDQAPRPYAQRLGRVCAGLAAAPSVEADVDERTHRLYWRLGLWHVVQAERDAISLHEPVGVGVMPGRVAELDRVIATARQPRQERFEARE